MEDKQFDELTKRLAAPVSRRTAVKAAVATALGGILTFGKSSGAYAAFAENCKCNGQPCLVSGECCSGACVSQPGTTVRVCACPAGTVPCQGTRTGTACVTNCTGGRVL